ncbi:MAG: ThiF family adenylyltransferase [Planctomycetales bacterium]|nr:ThiF family adenylyltransferase [Planctomycetales bacterium]MBN8625048.1 ThiF family adenylyltransferase [Planctomycetota bacterium]
MTLVEDFRWYPVESAWMLHCRLESATPATIHVPAVTEWYVRVPGDYPYGEVRWYPARNGGLTATFEHQQHNGEPPDDRPWRLGYPCVSTSAYGLGRTHLDSEPFACDARLAWQARRLVDWLENAAAGTLSSPGEPFELPCLPADHDTRPVVAFTEDARSLAEWDGGRNFGVVDLHFSKRNGDEFGLVGEFRTFPEEVAFQPTWGLAATAPGAATLAGWVRLPELPLLAPWGIPTTWGELRSCWPAAGPQLDRLLARLCDLLRGSPASYLLVGCPIPQGIGGAPTALHWFALRLPALPGEYPGFRNRAESLWAHERATVFANGAKLQWVATENWGAAQLATRGRLRIAGRTERLNLAGTGSLGAALAELLVRGGLTNITLIDPQTLAAGNLSRHPLTLDDVGRSKAKRLAARLNLAHPHARVVADVAFFPRSDEAARAAADPPLCMVDCTGEDEVLIDMAALVLSAPCPWLSFAFNVTASRLYCFASHGTSFDLVAFREQINGWLADDVRQHEGLVLPREGIGCWHPVFPARHDDVQLLAAAAVKWLDERLAADPAAPLLTVFQCDYDGDSFRGLRRIDGAYPTA